MARDKVILAYSGGLDTSVMVPWIGERYNMDVVTFTVDLGQGEDIERIRQKALRTGAVDAVAIDARNLFVDLFVWPALMAGAVYEGKYPLATALGRPLIAKLMVDAARERAGYILMFYKKFADKKPVMLLELPSQKIYAYPYADADSFRSVDAQVFRPLLRSLHVAAPQQ